jgi:lipopolysaccharide export system permease protein
VIWSILHRMILGELFKVFALALIALTGLVLLAGIVAEASQRGLGPAQVLAAIPLIIPSTLPYTIPATTLFATNLVYGRLAHDNEILAIKAAGVNILKVVVPAAILGIITGTVTMGLYYQLIPWTQYTLRAEFLKDVEEFLYNMLRQERFINHPRLAYAIWVKQVDGRRLIDATFKRRDAKGGYDLVVRAREAELRYQPSNKMLLVLMRNGEAYSVNEGNRAHFDNQQWEVKLPEGFPFGYEKMRKSREMDWDQLQERREEVTGELESVDVKIAEAVALMTMQRPPDDIKLHLQHLKNQKEHFQREMQSLDVEQQMRPAIAVGCLCFVLVGCPVGIWFSKSDYLSAFITCFLPIVFLYYPLLLCGINLTRNGRLHPGLTIWACDIIMGVIAVLLLGKLLKN